MGERIGRRRHGGNEFAETGSGILDQGAFPPLRRGDVVRFGEGEPRLGEQPVLHLEEGAGVGLGLPGEGRQLAGGGEVGLLVAGHGLVVHPRDAVLDVGPSAV